MSHTLLNHARRALCAVVAMLLVLSASPALAFADTVDNSTPSASSNTCTPVSAVANGIQQPTGSDAKTYTFNSCSGLWENPYYTWSPATQTVSPKTPPVYTCDESTWTWLTYTWMFSAAAQNFSQIASHTAVLPAGAIVAADSLNPCAPLPPQPVNGANGGNSTTTGMQNETLGAAASGNASVNGNTNAGGATSGDASAMATILNALQSSSSLTDGSVTTFEATINGDVQGDLIIDPTQLQPTSSSGTVGNGDVSMNNETNGQITNNVTLAATSGNAGVTNNTTAGGAKTGNATAIANVVNMLNSLVSAGKSFVGVVNINGNMHGNILLPQQLLDNLIASNAPSTTVTLNNTQANSLGIKNTNSLSTTNNVTSTATSGNANVSQNTKAGNATTGAATTQVRVFNLTGSQVIGTNCLLVFVNVSGKWIGVIFSAPAGATAAALGSGITTNSVDNAAISNTTNDAITNNIDVSALSGDATVADNTTAGSATSGDANAAVNLLNINNSSFNMSGWFGILFINIFGDWYGNLGVYNPAAQTGGRGGGHAATSQVFGYVPKTTSTSAYTGPSLSDLGHKLADNTGKALSQVAKTSKPKTTNAALNSQLIGGIIVALGLALFAGERLLSARQARANR